MDRFIKMTLIIGLDEAGRGPVIGPMFIAVCGVHDPAILEEIGVRDSKAYGSTRAGRLKRASLARRIASSCPVRVAQVMPWVIDEWVQKGPGLNVLERWVASGLIRSFGNDVRVFADGVKVFGPLADEFDAVVENKADATHAVVAAASIVAKDMRDRWFARYEALMRHRLGEAISGGGYPNSATERFVRQYLDRFGSMPPFTRMSWSFQDRFHNGTRSLELFNLPD